MSQIRQKRTADQILRELSLLCQREINDPRLQDITITDVTIDRELEHADIYVNAFGDESRRKEVMAGLDKASGFLRRELAGRLRLRTVPQLHFHWDPTLAHAARVDEILESLHIPPAESEPAGDNESEGSESA